MNFYKKMLMVLSVVPLFLSGIAQAKVDIEFILDASGSMRAAMAGKTQMDVAKQSIKAALDQIPSDTFVALRVYAHRVEQTDKTASCQDSELLIPFGPLDKMTFGGRVDSIQPKGYTPIGFSLQKAGEDIIASATLREADRVLVLVSDGEETCGADPVQVVKDLQAKGIKFKLNAVGFNVDAKAQAQLKALAAAGGGQYYDAKDADSLANSLKDITQKALVVDKTTSIYGSEVRGGDSYEKAAPVPLNQELRLDHYQRKNQYDYFYVDLKASQSLAVTITTGDKGVQIKPDNTIAYNESPYTGVQIHDDMRNRIAGEEIIGARNKTTTVESVATKTARRYILIGSIYEDVNKDHTFKVEVKSFPDAGTQDDAGNTPETALTIQRQAYPVNYMTKGDDADMYKVTTIKGEMLTVKIIPENPQSNLAAAFMDDLRVEIAQAAAPNPGAGFRITGTATGTTTYLKVISRYGEENTKYSLEFETAGLATSVPTASVAPVTPPGSTPPATVTTAPVPTAPALVPQEAPTVISDKPISPPSEIKNEEVKTEASVSAEKSSGLQWKSVLKDKDSMKVAGGLFGGGVVLGVILGIVLKTIFGAKYIKP